MQAMKRERAPWLPLALLFCMIGMAAATTIIGYGRPVVQDLAGAFWPEQAQVMLWYLTSGAVGVLILWHRPGNILGWILAAVGLVLGLGGLAFEYRYFTQVSHPGALPAGGVAAWLDASLDPYPLALLALLILLFPTGRPLSRRWGWVRWLVAAGALDFACLAIYRIFAKGAPSAQTGQIEQIFSVGWLMLLPAFALAAISLVLRFWRAKGDERQQLKWLAYALTLFVVGGVFRGVVLGIVFGGRWDIPGWLVDLVGLSIPVSVGIAVLKYRLYDIDVVIRRTLWYGVLTGLLALIYLGSVASLQGIFTLVSGQRSALAVVLSTLAIAALFSPLRRRVQELIDRRFYRRKYNAAQALAAFAIVARDEVDLDSLNERLLAVVESTVQPAQVSTVTLIAVPAAQVDGRASQVRRLDLDVAPNDPLLAYLQSVHGAVDVRKLQLASPALDRLRGTGVVLVLPLVSQGELVGLINLGPRLSEQDYSSDDRKMLADLAFQAAPAVRVAQLVRQQQEQTREREHMQQELRVARVVQQTLLPKELPALAGWRFAAHWEPARAVGGDFYDFIPFKDGRLAIYVADVTDKGVPAALVMASARSILRAAAERLVSPGAVLERANEMLCLDLGEKMFVTCLYLLLDPASGRLCYANAGHNLPSLRTADGVVELRATGMPLGLFSGMSYEEKEVSVSFGDSVLIYSDGITEAHSPQGEMFGFPRLRELLTRHLGGETLIEFLRWQLAEFTGPGWEQEDDVTFVVIERTPQAYSERPVSQDGWTMLADFAVASAPKNERQAMEQVVRAVAGLDLSPAQLDRLKTAVAEATMNAMEHGNHYQPDRPVAVHVLTREGELAVRITDCGGDRAVPEHDTPDLDAKLAGAQSPRGWGLFLIRNMVDDMRLISDDTHHTIELVIKLGENDGSNPTL